MWLYPILQVSKYFFGQFEESKRYEKVCINVRVHNYVCKGIIRDGQCYFQNYMPPVISMKGIKACSFFITVKVFMVILKSFDTDRQSCNSSTVEYCVVTSKTYFSQAKTLMIRVYPVLMTTKRCKARKKSK